MVIYLSICVIKKSTELGLQFVLTPERYNPKRRMSLLEEDTAIRLSEIVTLKNDVIIAKKNDGLEWHQINTSDAMGGYLRIPAKTDVLNCNKKLIKSGDVIISRLRPYLRQVAYVDKENVNLCASTEFYVLRARNHDSLAYLVPFLLSDAVQTVFANAVEGSQHPRFKEDDILNLIVPTTLFKEREAISQRIKNAIASYRAYEESLSAEIFHINDTLQKFPQ